MDTRIADVVQGKLKQHATKVVAAKFLVPEGKHGRRPDLDGVCARCQADGQATHGPGYGQTFAYYTAPIKNKKGRVVHPAEVRHWCPYHQRGVDTA